MAIPDRGSIDKYMSTSKKLADPQLTAKLRGLFERRYTLVELIEWVHEKVQWSDGKIIRHTDPLDIITYGRGRCGEFSILFTALCRAHDYRARVVLDMTDHVWTEVWDRTKRKWIHVDPSERRIDDPLMYERDWKKNLTRIYAFENGRMENVTKRYKSQSTKNYLSCIEKAAHTED